MAVRLFSSNFSVFPVPVCLSRLADQLQVELDSILFVRESKWVAGETTTKRIPRCPGLWLLGVCGLRFAVCGLGFGLCALRFAILLVIKVDMTEKLGEEEGKLEVLVRRLCMVK
jgi:hypothetical protein